MAIDLVLSPQYRALKNEGGELIFRGDILRGIWQHVDKGNVRIFSYYYYVSSEGRRRGFANADATVILTMCPSVKLLSGVEN